MKISQSPLISIIVNCYNGEKYLAQALECILKQTYKNKLNLKSNFGKDTITLYKN